MKFKIEKNIPIPTAGGRTPKNEFPLESMEVGESFFVAGSNVKKMNGQLSHYKKTLGLTVAVRAATGTDLDDEGNEITVEGVRVWLKAKPTPAATEGDEDGDQTDAGDEGAEEPEAEPEAPKKSGKKSGKKAEAESDY